MFEAQNELPATMPTFAGPWVYPSDGA